MHDRVLVAVWLVLLLAIGAPAQAATTTIQPNSTILTEWGVVPPGTEAHLAIDEGVNQADPSDGVKTKFQGKTFRVGFEAVPGNVQVVTRIKLRVYYKFAPAPGQPPCAPDMKYFIDGVQMGQLSHILTAPGNEISEWEWTGLSYSQEEINTLEIESTSFGVAWVDGSSVLYYPALEVEITFSRGGPPPPDPSG